MSGIVGVRLEDVRRDWSRPGFTVGVDHFVAVDSGRLGAYAAVSPGQTLVLSGSDVATVDQLLERVVARARSRGDTALTLSGVSPESPLAGVVQRHPFELDRETLRMGRSLVGAPVEPHVPVGVTLRTFEPADAVAVHRLLDEAYLSWDARYVPVAHEDWVAFMTGDSEFDATTWWVAERDGVVVGCALFWNTGWLKDLAVIASERGAGLGAALAQTGFAEFARRGKGRVGLRADASNPTGALALYERLGFVTLDRESIWRLAL